MITDEHRRKMRVTATRARPEAAAPITHVVICTPPTGGEYIVARCKSERAALKKRGQFLNRARHRGHYSVREVAA